MVNGLARLGSAALTVAEFAIVLVAILLLGATTIPALMRKR
jgi:Sec-independent protein translocase protein TatA